MKTNHTYTGDPIRGLAEIMAPGSTGLWRHFDQTSPHAVYHESHPFGLPTPPPHAHHYRREYVLTGGGYDQRNNMVVVSFLANIRYWAGFEEGAQIEGLRVITTPFHDGDPDNHFVFFEARIGNSHFISGETTDFPGGTRHDMIALEDVFALLSQIYKISIERVSAEMVPLATLYMEKVEA